MTGARRATILEKLAALQTSGGGGNDPMGRINAYNRRSVKRLAAWKAGKAKDPASGSGWKRVGMGLGAAKLHSSGVMVGKPKPLRPIAAAVKHGISQLGAKKPDYGVAAASSLAAANASRAARRR